MKILLGYSYFQHPVDVKGRVEEWLTRLRGSGFQVESFALTPNPPAPPLTWQQLDHLWKIGDRNLLNLYENLAQRLEDFDVFLNCNGINVHPDFVSKLKKNTVYACFDDPESSEKLSRHTATAYDLALVGNIACLDMYKSWGVKNVRWWPIGFHPNDFDPTLTKERILSRERDIDISILCERTTPWRKERLDHFTKIFPTGTYYGQDWPNGFLAMEKRVSMFQRTKIGPNFHNSIGPVNSRTFVLPANGILQVCDNKSFLGEIFELEKEVIGFNSVDEAIDLCRYYLEHDKERRQIAADGWERAHRDYNEIKVFELVEKYVNEVSDTKKDTLDSININKFLITHTKKTFFNRILYRLLNLALYPLKILRSNIHNMLRKDN